MPIKVSTFLVYFFIMAMSCNAVAAKPESTGPAASKTEQQDSVIRGEVKRLVALMSDGVAEEAGSPIIAYAPPGSVDPGTAVALFYIEGWNGGNAHSGFLAIFEPTDTSGWSPDWKPNLYHLIAFTPARGDMQWEVDGRRLTVDKSGVITIEGMTWGPDDAHCCPKKPVTIKFRYDGYQLTELK